MSHLMLLYGGTEEPGFFGFAFVIDPEFLGLDPPETEIFGGFFTP